MEQREAATRIVESCVVPLSGHYQLVTEPVAKKAVVKEAEAAAKTAAKEDCEAIAAAADAAIADGTARMPSAGRRRERGRTLAAADAAAVDLDKTADAADAKTAEQARKPMLPTRPRRLLTKPSESCSALTCDA